MLRMYLAYFSLIFALLGCSSSIDRRPKMDAEVIQGQKERVFFRTDSARSAEVLLSEGKSFPGRKVLYSDGKLTELVSLPASALSFSPDEKVVSIVGEPGLYEFSSITIVDLSSGLVVPPPATVEVRCTQLSESGYTELLVESAAVGYQFTGLTPTKRETVGGNGSVLKSSSGNFVNFEKASFGTLQVNFSLPKANDIYSFKAILTTLNSSVWNQVQNMYCKMNDVPVPTQAPGSYQEMILADGPYGYWRLNELSGGTAIDSSGAERNALYLGNPVLGMPGAILGTSNTSVFFNRATRSNAAFSRSPSILDFEFNDSFTLEAWIKTNNATNNQMILAKQFDFSPWTGYYLLVCNESFYCPRQNVLSAYLEATSTQLIQVQGATNIVDNQWHHVVVTYSGTGNAAGFRLYVDGNPEVLTAPQDNLGNASIKNGASFNIGSRANGDYAFEGFIDEAAVYGTVLSPARIQKHFSMGKTGQ